MIYGLYLSANGVMANAHRQDVIANNLANAETVGFKRDLATFRQRRTEAREQGLGPSGSDPHLEGIGGGLTIGSTVTDLSQADLETTGRDLDLAIRGNGYFAVQGKDGKTQLTRDGRLRISREGTLVRATDGLPVLDDKRLPITLKQTLTHVDNQGVITQESKNVAKIGVFTVPREALLTKQGSNLFDYPNADKQIGLAQGADIESGSVERSNVEPTTELSALMETQRQLEANANMIRFQDQTLSRLVNDVGKIG